MERIVVNATDPDPQAIARAAQAILRGEVVAMPTDTLYGLAVDPFSHAAVSRIFSLKGRPEKNPLPLVANDHAQIHEWLGDLTPLGYLLAQHFWPGPLTLIVRGPLTLDHRVSSETHTVGVRVPDHEVTRALCRAAGRPLTATSANPTGTPATGDPDIVASVLGKDLGVLLDGGFCRGGAPSTMVDVTRSTPHLVREGAIPWEKIQACVRHG